jgi:hypothetical protein
LQALSATSYEREWASIAAKEAKKVGLHTSAKAVRLMDTVARAPETRAAVER